MRACLSVAVHLCVCVYTLWICESPVIVAAKIYFIMIDTMNMRTESEIICNKVCVCVYVALGLLLVMFKQSFMSPLIKSKRTDRFWRTAGAYVCFFAELEGYDWLTFNNPITKIINLSAKHLVMCAMTMRGYLRAPAIFIHEGAVAICIRAGWSGNEIGKYGDHLSARHILLLIPFKQLCQFLQGEKGVLWTCPL